MDNLNIPEHVSYAVRDAWNAVPPCSYSLHPFCHVDCPYHYECFPDFYDIDDEYDL